MTYAPEKMFNFISNSHARKAGFKIFTEDDNMETSRGITKIVHKATGRNSITCIENSHAPDEAMIYVQMAAVVLPKNSDPWHKRLFNVASDTIKASREMVLGLLDMNLSSDSVCVP